MSFAVEPSRIMIFMPRFFFSIASWKSVDSWSVEILYDAYFFKSSPLKHGAWPSIGLDKPLEISNFLITSSSSPMTPLKFIISPKATISSRFNSSSTSSLSKVAPLPSNEVAGTQEGAVK